MQRTLTLASFLALFCTPLLAQPARADVLIDDFEDVSDWSGLTVEAVEVQNGAGAGRWADHPVQSSIRKVFEAPLDLSDENQLQVWLYSGVANGAQIELVFDSENEADAAGWDYYSYPIVVDWTGWRFLSIPLESFGAARNPVGWNEINDVRLSASGWGHEALPDTLLILDDMSFAAGVIGPVQPTSGYEGDDYVFEFTVTLEERTGSARTLDLSVSADVEGAPIVTSAAPAQVMLGPNTTTDVVVTVTVLSTAIGPETYLNLHPATLLVTEGGIAADALALEAAVPLPERSHPRMLATLDDFSRMNVWSDAHAWASSARDTIISAADRWPATYEDEYGLVDWELPPEGGQWTLWYVCPTHGIRLGNEGATRHVCPVDDEVWSGWPYDQVVFSWMHRDLASYARDLGLAYRLTGDLTYAQSAAEILLAYADAYSNYDIHDINGGEANSGGRVLSQTLDESIWLIPMAWSYDLIADSGALSDEGLAHVEHDLLRASADTVNRHHAGISNWQSWHNAGMGAVGFALDDPSLMARAIEGPDGFIFQMAESVTADGFWYEGSWSYHFYALDAHVYLAEMATRAGVDLWSVPELRAMFEAPLAFSMPDLTLPPFNDSGVTNLVGRDRVYEIAFARYGDPLLTALLGQRNRRREGLLWGVETLPDSTALATPSVLFPDAGYAVLRVGSGDDAIYAAFDFGPHGGGHGHYDKLGFVLFAEGMVMGVDPGTQSYAAPTHDTWDKETVAHNTVVVDETTQHSGTGVLHYFAGLPGLAVASAGADEANDGASLLRSLALTEDYLLDAFWASNDGGEASTFDWIYHNMGVLSAVPASEAYSDFPPSDGYQHLFNEQVAGPAAAWSVDFDASEQALGSFGSVWADSDGIVGSFEVSDAQAHDGVRSGALNYDFTASQGYIIFTANLGQTPAGAIDEAPAGVGLWLSGDESGHQVTIRVYDSTGERFVNTLGSIDWSGWQLIELNDIASWTHYLGNDDGVFDQPAGSIAIQVSSVEGSPAAGTLYVDDLVLTYEAAGAVQIADFEVIARALRLRMLGSPGQDTTVVTGEGLGPDLRVPVPFALARRSAPDTVFVSLLEPYADAPVVTGFEALPTEVERDDAVAVTVTTASYRDALLLVAGDVPERRTFGESACDGVVCLIRRATNDTLSRLVLAGGRALEDGSTSLITLEATTTGLQVDYHNSGAELLLVGEATDGEVRIFAPNAESVLVQGVAIDFERDGDHIVINGLPDVGPDAGPSDAGGADAGDPTDASMADGGGDDTGFSDPDGGSDAGDGPVGGLTDVSGGQPDVGATPMNGSSSEDDGCGCTTAGHSPNHLVVLALTLAIVSLRRRSWRGRPAPRRSHPAPRRSHPISGGASEGARHSRP